jgi:RNA polymerase sigma-70 factor (ECF subfamily)
MLATSTSLLRGLRARDAEAWNQMVNLYFPFVYRWCVRAGLPEADIPDAVQEVFRAVADGVSAFRRDQAGDTFRGWLRGITRHKIQDYWRHRLPEAQAEGGTAAQQRLAELTDPMTADSQDADVPETARMVKQVLAQVQAEFEPATWEAFWRVTVDNHVPTDVAADLGLTVNAVYKAKCRVIRRLREALGDVV